MYSYESNSCAGDENKQCSGEGNLEEIKESGGENQENMESEANPED